MALVVGYHRVVETPHPFDPWCLSVSVARFAEQMEWLRRRFEVVPLDELRARRLEGRSLEGLASVTFDDGYVNNLTLAGAVLRRLSVPATLFLATGFLGRPAFWWDVLEGLVRAAGDAERMRLEAVWQELRDLPRAGVEARLAALAVEWDVESVVSSPPAENRPMTPDEVERLPSELFSVAPHTVNHPWLPCLSEEAQAEEIRGSVERCRAWSGRETRLFAYPFGAAEPTTVRALRSCGVDLALTTQPGLVTQATDPMSVPRLLALDWNAEELERVIDGAPWSAAEWRP